MSGRDHGPAPGVAFAVVLWNELVDMGLDPKAVPGRLRDLERMLGEALSTIKDLDQRNQLLEAFVAAHDGMEHAVVSFEDAEQATLRLRAAREALE